MSVPHPFPEHAPRPLAARRSVLSKVFLSFMLSPPPGGLQPTSSAVIDCFTLFQRNWLLGLLDLDLLILVSAVLGVPIYLALYVVLRRVSPSLMALALAFGLVGMAAYFAANPAFSMLTLSNQ